jgi:hypothetical protein
MRIPPLNPPTTKRSTNAAGTCEMFEKIEHAHAAPLTVQTEKKKKKEGSYASGLECASWLSERLVSLL